MTHKKFWLAILLMAFTMTVAGCGGDKKPEPDENISVLPEWINDFPPEYVLWGIGVAQTESDGESILLAEDRARISIARQLATKVNFYAYTFEDQTVEISHQTTSTFVNGSRVTKRYKSKDGTWWCLVELPKANAYLSAIKPAQDDIAAMLQVMLRSNMENWSVIENAVTVDDIPEWVFNAGPEDMICGVGAAKSGEAVYMAIDRARRSLARSLSSEINAALYDYYVNGASIYGEEGFSITSVYEYTPIQTLLLDQAKTKDGTLWVLLGCHREVETNDFSELRRQQALEILDRALEQIE